LNPGLFEALPQRAGCPGYPVFGQPVAPLRGAKPAWAIGGEVEAQVLGANYLRRGLQAGALDAPAVLLIPDEPDPSALITAMPPAAECRKSASMVIAIVLPSGDHTGPPSNRPIPAPMAAPPTPAL